MSKSPRALPVIVALTVAIPIGIYSAMRQDTAGDYIARSFSLLMLAVPGFWLGTLVMVFPSVWWRWSPPLEYTPFFQDPIANLSHMIVPAILLGLSMSAVTMRMTRTMMLEVLRQDYVRTARAKGIRPRQVTVRHIFRNALLAVVSAFGFTFAALISEAVVTETVFALPGIGRLVVQSILRRDYPVIQGVILVTVALYLVINLLVDLINRALDPRVELE